jgi:xanthine dehydrogenase YagT iron-sulfur-binding subunit
MHMDQSEDRVGRDHAAGRLSRRRFLASSAAASAGVAVGPAVAETAAGAASAGAGPAGGPPAGGGPAGANPVEVDLVVNGQREHLSLDPRVTLLDALRDRLGLTGTKKGCDLGQCGSCTVHVDGRRVLSCLTLAASADGQRVTTIEGLARGETLHPVQQAFIDHDAFQCGFCTPGQIMSAVALLAQRQPLGSDDEIRDLMSGNICRCGAYGNILDAIKTAAGQ